MNDNTRKKRTLYGLLSELWHRWKQHKQIIRNHVMKKIYQDFFDLHEERKSMMLHNVDLYSPGPPITVPSYEMLDLVEKYAGKTILDIGCGHAVYGKELLKKGFNYTGIEANEAYAKVAGQSVDATLMRAESLGFKDKSFDTVMMFEVLEHLDDPYTSLEEIVRVTRKNLILTVPNISPMIECVEYNVVMHHFLESTHVNFFTGKMLERFLKQYFPYVEVTEFGRFFNLSGSKLNYHLKAIASFDKIQK
ncbi:MAG: methyltransferase domain-containing protein [bacterium]|nr:methyltransferase domain-containing protein [bacterium]